MNILTNEAPGSGQEAGHAFSRHFLFLSAGDPRRQLTMLSCGHPGRQGPKNKKCLQEEEAARHGDDAESWDESSGQAGGARLAQSVSWETERARRLAYTQPHGLPFRNSPRGWPLRTRRKMIGCWCVGKFLAPPKGPCDGGNIQYTTPLDSDDKPGKMEDGHWIKDQREPLMALEGHSWSWNDRGKDWRRDLIKKQKTTKANKTHCGFCSSQQPRRQRMERILRNYRKASEKLYLNLFGFNTNAPKLTSWSIYPIGQIFELSEGSLTEPQRTVAIIQVV